jgi:hypothetical protein
VPEPALAARAVPAPPERPLPTIRRAIFFDVENTSRAEHISRVIAHLAVDRNGRRTEFFAVGNWRVIGHDTARLLARHGAQLVHSAPSVGVRDWSDLRIAVASGVWLATARPDDVIEIVSDDRAFDAVGDVAASLGVTFHRLSYRGLLGMPVADVPEREVPAESSHGRHAGGGRSRRGRRGRRHGRPEHGGRTAVPEPSVTPAPAVHTEPHTAPHDEIVAVVHELAQSGRNVTLDSLANALKARGFSRPPGSPRLITRLRRIKELEVSRSGVITLHDGAPQRPAEPEAVAEPPDAAPLSEEPEQPVVPAAETEADEADVIEPGNDRRFVHEPRRDDGGQGRRRSRRGGRRRRGGRGGGGGGGGGARPPMDHRGPPRDVPPPRDAAAREAAVREAFRTRTAPSYITGEPLA